MRNPFTLIRGRDRRASGALICLAVAPAWAQTTVPFPMTGPYTARCSVNPVSEVPPVLTAFVTDEPNILVEMAKSCDPVAPLAESFNKIYELLNGKQGDTLHAAWEAGKASKEFLGELATIGEAIKGAAGGLELYVVKCAGKPLWNQFLSKLPEPVADLFRGPMAAYDTKQNVDKYLAEAQAVVTRGTTTSRQEAQVHYDNLKKIAKGVGDPIKKLSSYQQMASSFTERWESILPHQGELWITANKVADTVTAVNGNCRITEAEHALETATARGKALVESARLAYARAAKEEIRLREMMNMPAAVGEIFDSPLRANWTRWKQVRDYADSTVKSLEESLTRIGQTCGRLKEQASNVQSRRSHYLQTAAKAAADIEACRLDLVPSVIRNLEALEGGSCGGYFMGGADLDPRLEPSPFVPGGIPISVTTFGPESRQLASKLESARDRCSLCDIAGGWKFTSPNFIEGKNVEYTMLVAQTGTRFSAGTTYVFGDEKRQAEGSGSFTGISQSRIVRKRRSPDDRVIELEVGFEWKGAGGLAQHLGKSGYAVCDSRGHAYLLTLWNWEEMERGSAPAPPTYKPPAPPKVIPSERAPDTVQSVGASGSAGAVPDFIGPVNSAAPPRPPAGAPGSTGAVPDFVGPVGSAAGARPPAVPDFIGPSGSGAAQTERGRISGTLPPGVALKENPGAPASSGRSIAGPWRYRAVCNSDEFEGVMNLAQDSSGRYNGAATGFWINAAASAISAGVVKGDQVTLQFRPNGWVESYTWNSRFVNDPSGERVEGQALWRGQPACSFFMDRNSGPAPGVDVTGTWRYTASCGQDSWQGSMTVNRGSDGKFGGRAEGNWLNTGSSDLWEGTVYGTEFQFRFRPHGWNEHYTWKTRYNPDGRIVGQSFWRGQPACNIVMSR